MSRLTQNNLFWLRPPSWYLEGAPNFKTRLRLKSITITNIQNSTLNSSFDALSKWHDLDTSLKHLWWKSCDVYELKRRSEDHTRSPEALEFEIIHLKQMLQHLTINKIPHNIADPSYPYGDNGIWEIKCEQDDFFPSYEFQLWTIKIKCLLEI